MSERLIAIENTVERHSEAIANLKEWQGKQNGSLVRIDDRLHSLERWIMATLATAFLSVLMQFLLRR